MTARLAVEVTILAAVCSPMLLLLPRVYLALRDYCRLRREWVTLAARVEAARADFEEVRADMRESLLDRIARDELAGFFEEWEEGIIR